MFLPDIDSRCVILKQRCSQLEDYKYRVNALQARIDELMFEYCPEEMTEDQLEEYRKSIKTLG